LLRERLADFSFNWILENRVLPFGTFINGIDYALFLAAMLGLGVAWLMQEAGGRWQVAGGGEQEAGGRRQVAGGEQNDCLLPTASRLLLTAYCLLSVVLIGIALLLTYKGSGLLALAGAGAVFALVVGAGRGWQVAGGRWREGSQVTAYCLRPTAYCLLGLLLLGIIFFEPIVQRGAFLLQREMGNSYETGRLEIWIQALAALPQRPFFGFGLNNAGQLIAPTQSLRGGTFIAVSNSPESAYVATLVETGIVGFAAWLWFIGAVLVRAYQRARASMLYAGVLAAIVALLCGNLTVSALTTDQNGLLLGVLIGMVFVDDERACL
jgi:O-antigen ligase